MAIQIKRMIQKLKNPYWRAKSNYIKYYDRLPINDKMILLESQHGREFNGNIFSIAQYLSSNEQYRDYTIYLSCTYSRLQAFSEKLEQYGIENVKLTIFSSDQYVRALASAKYLINDNTFMPFYMKKEGQVYCNTWHGTPLKSLGRKIKNDACMIGNAQKNFVVADYILFPNQYTKDHMVEDYMIGNISHAKCVYGGYPRNDVFFNCERRRQLRSELGLNDCRVYAYMPTFRGTARAKALNKSDAYLLYYLYELDKRLQEDEILFLNLHPVAQDIVNFSDFEHIRCFPAQYDNYDFLNIADVLVSDYSSVFFDFACTGKKIVLFTFDKEDYLKDRGVYLSLDSLPYPQVSDVDELLKQLRSPKQYDDAAFVRQFCPYDDLHATARLCDFVILGKDTGLPVEDMPDNGKENVLIYLVSLAANGITASLRNLMNSLDLDKRNYYISFDQSKIKADAHVLSTFPQKANYYATAGGMNLTILQRVIRKLFKKKIISAPVYMKLCGRRIRQDLQRNFDTSFQTVIQFSGYVPEQILRFSAFDGKKIIYMHSDMVTEIKIKGNQRKDVLRYAYRRYDKVAVVTEDLIPSALQVSKKKANIRIANNAINYKEVLQKSKAEPAIDPFTVSHREPDEIMDFINDPTTVKFISVGRFAPEKGHKRLVDAFARFAKDHDEARLIIVGGYSYQNHYNLLLTHIRDIGLEDKILLIQKVSNPHAIVKACDYFVLSSYYEGFGLVLAEADVIGLPVVSTDIVGPRGFMIKYGGTMVENSQEGLYQGFRLLYEGKIAPMGVDYAAYNREVVEQFEQLLTE